MRHNQLRVSLLGESETQTGADDYAVAMRLTDPPDKLAERKATAPRVIPTAFLSGIW